jgi:hypothetical protein
MSFRGNTCNAPYYGISFELMKILTILIARKAVLLPVMLTVALSLVALGMRPPQLQKIDKPRVHHRDVVQNQDKASQAGVEKHVQPVGLCRCLELIGPPASYRVSFIPFEERDTNPTAVSFVPARAPPTPLV